MDTVGNDGNEQTPLSDYLLCLTESNVDSTDVIKGLATLPVVYTDVTRRGDVIGRYTRTKYRQVLHYSKVQRFR